MADLTALDAQLAEMERSLMDDPGISDEVRAYLHLVAARRLLAKQGGAASVQPQVSRPLEDRRSVIAPSRGVGKIARRVDPDRVKVLEHAANAIRGKVSPTKTAEIFELIPDEVRALIRGSEPKSNLSAMLFHSPSFISHGRQGWVLRREAVTEEREDNEDVSIETEEEDDDEL